MGESQVAAVVNDRFIDRFLGRVPVEYKADFAERKIETNLTRTLMLSSFIIFVQIFLNIMNILKSNVAAGGGGGGGEDVTKYIILSMTTLAVGIIYLILSLIIRRGHLKNRTFRKILPFSLLLIYCGIQMVFVYFNVSSQAEAGLNSYIIALILAGFFIIMPPLLNFVLCAALFTLALGILTFAQADGDLMEVILLGDSWANLMIITLLVMFMAYATYIMYRDNFLNSKQLEISNERLDMLAKTDGLTGLLNRWGFYETIDKSWGGYISQPGVVSVFMFDIDYFKEYNDEHGHLAGDENLRVVAKTIKECFAETEDGTVCRFGGEEFLCLVRLHSEKEARDLAEKTRVAVAEAGEKLNQSADRGSVTISGGFAINTDGNYVAFDDLVSRADKALYDAKEIGRNRICFYQENTGE